MPLCGDTMSGRGVCQVWCKACHVIKRSQPAWVLERSPLVFFLAQVRFAEILSMAQHVPAVQEGLRKAGFPLLQRSIVKSFTVGPGGMPTLEDRELWHFKNIEQTRAITLTRDSVSFQTTDYKTYDAIAPLFDHALEQIHKVVEINVLQRCGLRYLDVVNPAAGEDFLAYLRPEILGLYAQATFGVEPEVQSSFFRAKTECGTLVVKFTTTEAPNILPADLMPAILDLRMQIPARTKIGTLDFDHFTAQQSPFSLERASALLGDLHDAITRALAACVTPDAFKLWGKRDV